MSFAANRHAVVRLVLVGLTAGLLFAVVARADAPRVKKPKRAVPRAVPRAGEHDENEKIRDARDGEWERLVYPGTRPPPGDWRGRALSYVAATIREAAPLGVSTFVRTDMKGAIPPGTTWTEMGPKPLDGNGTSTGYHYGIVAGRMNAVAFADASTAYAGGPVGGLWKTTNCCSSATAWTPLWDAVTFDAQSVGAIAIDPNDSRVIYVGTGDSQAPQGDSFGNGVYKSTDAGATWTHYGAGVFSPYVSAGPPGASCCASAPDESIKAIAVDPHDSNTVIAGASFGLFISHDAGVTWTQYFVTPMTGAYADDAQRVTSLLIDGSTTPSTLYVAIGYPYDNIRPTRVGLSGGANGVYKAAVPASGVPSFTLLNNGWPAGTGNGTTTSGVGRIELARNTTTGRIYAQVQDYVNTNALGTWTSGDAGATWTLLANSGNGSYVACNNSPTNESQDWYNLFIGIDPADDHTLYIGRTDLYKATVDSTYTSLSSLQALGNVYTTSCPGYGTLHPDHHGFAFVPGGRNFVAGNDGGVYFGTGAVGGFTELNGTIGTNQFYAGQLGANYANASTQYAFGGMQDNGSASWDSTKTDLRWTARSVGGDGFFVAFDPIAGTNTSGRWWTEYAYGDTSQSASGAAGLFNAAAPAYANAGSALGIDTRGFSTPFLLDQWNCTTTNCNDLVLGTSRVWARLMNTGGWVATGTTDLTKGTANRYLKYIYGIGISPSNPRSVIVGTGDGNVQWSNNVFGGANCTAAAANTASFACTIDTAATWVNLTGNNAVLPNRAIGGVAFDPADDLVFYAAVGGFEINTPSTPGHVFRGVCSASPCTASNVTWTDKSGQLPDIPFEAIAVNPARPNQVFAGSYLGFFYTNDITADPPLWLRYQAGMPNTRIPFLTVDRGASASPKTSTTLAAFTYGRGLYVTKLDLPGNPSLHRVSGDTITKLDARATSTKVTWDVATCPPSAGENYNLVYGWGSGLSSYTFAGATCSIGTGGTFTWTPTPSPPAGERLLWYLIVESDGAGSEGSWGLDSAGNERKGLTPSYQCGAESRVNLACP